jgi:hypothetical protein
MDNQMTKARLLVELRAARNEWDTLMAAVGEERMTEPGAAGDWSVKDVTAHLTSFDQWFVKASEPSLCFSVLREAYYGSERT